MTASAKVQPGGTSSSVTWLFKSLPSHLYHCTAALRAPANILTAANEAGGKPDQSCLGGLESKSNIRSNCFARVNCLPLAATPTWPCLLSLSSRNSKGNHARPLTEV